MANRRDDKVVPDGYIKYLGEYKKVFYDIITINGSKYEYCWPNAGFFHPSIGEPVASNRVFAIKEAESPYGK